MSAEEIFRRLEACNFFRLQVKGKEFVLLLNHEKTELGVDFEVKEDLMKLMILLAVLY